MLELSKILIESLKQEKITYCHWKSNLLLHDALGGYDDLDLLISKNCLIRFEKIIDMLGFKEASNKNITFISIKHFYGLDIESGEILHLHIYYEIRTGASWTKSIHFNFEHYILDNCITHVSGMRVPEKHIEFIIFIIRIIIKYSTINEYFVINKEHKRTINEIEYLKLDLDETKLNLFIDSFFSRLSRDDFFHYENVIRTGTFLKRYITANKLMYKLKEYRDFGIIMELFKNFKQLTYRVSNKVLFRKKKSFSSGGLFIAVAGLDATGKTTITNDLKIWLNKNFTTTLVHFGKPPSSFLTLPFNLIIRIKKRSSLGSPLKSSIKNTEGSRSFFYVLRQVILAYDRKRLVYRQLKKVTNSEIVLCDRYKTENGGVMDSKRLSIDCYTGIKRRLAILENKFYDSMPQPDIIFNLTVPVEIAVIRNTERIKEGKETAEFIRIRHKENVGLSYKAKNYFEIDTNREYSKVISEIKSKIWELLQ